MVTGGETFADPVYPPCGPETWLKKLIREWVTKIPDPDKTTPGVGSDNAILDAFGGPLDFSDSLRKMDSITGSFANIVASPAAPLIGAVGTDVLRGKSFSDASSDFLIDTITGSGPWSHPIGDVVDDVTNRLEDGVKDMLGLDYISAGTYVKNREGTLDYGMEYRLQKNWFEEVRGERDPETGQIDRGCVELAVGTTVTGYKSFRYEETVPIGGDPLAVILTYKTPSEWWLHGNVHVSVDAYDMFQGESFKDSTTVAFDIDIGDAVSDTLGWIGDTIVGLLPGG